MTALHQDRDAHKIPAANSDHGVVAAIRAHSTPEQICHTRVDITNFRISQRVFADILSVGEAVSLCAVALCLIGTFVGVDVWSGVSLGLLAVISCVSIAGSSLLNRKSITLPALNMHPSLSAAVMSAACATYLLAAVGPKIGATEVAAALAAGTYVSKQLKIAIWRFGVRRGTLKRLVAIIGKKPARRDHVLAWLVDRPDAQVVFFGSPDRLPVMEKLSRDGRLDEVYLADHVGLELEHHLIGFDVSILRADIPEDTLPGTGSSSLSGFISVVHQSRRRDWAALAKRAMDVVGSAILIALLSPLFVIVAALIKLTSHGPVFFFQERFGYRMRSFNIMKFRTMYTKDADATGMRLTTRDDPRVTRIGRFLRRTSIDELPQLFNVFLGDMSLVGPRPHPSGAKAGSRLYDELIPDFYQRYVMPPGMTGLAQICGFRGNTETEMDLRLRFEKDMEYARTWSPWLDVVILFGTIRHLANGGNAY